MSTTEDEPSSPPTADLVAEVRDALTVKEVAELLGVNERTLVLRIRSGELRCFVPVNGRRLITRADLNRWLETTREQPRAAGRRAVRNPEFAKRA